MPSPLDRTARERLGRAKATVDFATGEVHDRLIDTKADKPEAGQPAARPEIVPAARDRRARAANPKSQRRWVKARKIP